MTPEEAKRYLTDLLARRRKWVEATSENQFQDGIQRLLSDLYPDEAHFVFELLQNAEDAAATKVNFHLQPDKLIVTHNGKRRFQDKDVDSITSIGKSSKRDDVNQIGKFGVGFKAVFGYTMTPRVESGPFAFEIRDLVCPYPFDSIHVDETDTRFEFPFNNATKPPTQCFSEIADWLSKMGDNTLLFLRNIKDLSWEIDSRDAGTSGRRFGSGLRTD